MISLVRMLVVVLCGAVLFGFSASISYAQEGMRGQNATLPPKSANGVVKDVPTDNEGEHGQQNNTVSCFDYYHFGSVQTQLTSSLTNVASGTNAFFSGTVRNDNAYPIVDGALYVKVLRVRTSEKNVNGPDVVDQFLVKSDVVIPANASLPVAFAWKVPAYAVSGEYRIVTFFTTSRKFNLLGLSFTDDVVGPATPFTVVGEAHSSVSFDKSSVTVGGKPYHFAAFPPRESQKDPVTLTAMVHNATKEKAMVQVSWVIYQWDAQLRQNVIQEEVPKKILVPAGASMPVSVTVHDALYPVYYVVGTLAWKDTKSIIGARFVRAGVDRARINFPGLASYPLKRGVENTLFSCVHNAGTSVSLPHSRLELSLFDEWDNEIHSYTYNGDVTSAMMGVADTFIPQRDYTTMTLIARLYSNDEIVDEARLVYDCHTLAPDSCQGASDNGMQTDKDENARGYLRSNWVLVSVTLALLVAVVAGFIAYRRSVQ